MIPVHIPALKYLTQTALIECIDLTATARLTLESANIQSNQGLGRLAYDACQSQVTDKIQPLSNYQRRLFRWPRSLRSNGTLSQSQTQGFHMDAYYGCCSTVRKHFRALEGVLAERGEEITEEESMLFWGRKKKWAR